MTDIEVGSADWWLARLVRKLGERQDRYDKLNNWAIGKHPLPNGDTRYVRALEDLQKKSLTNYVGLALKATTQRMRVREFKFGGEVDTDAGHFWKANSMELQSAMSIADAAKLSDTYALVSPPEDGIPVITVEDPRQCAVERDPVRPTRSIAGLKLYADDMIERLVAVVYLPEAITVYYGPKPGNDFDYERIYNRIADGGPAAAGFELVEEHENILGQVPLVWGQWQPETGLSECEDGALEVQDRINHTMLARLIITKSQAYRQRMISGVKIPKGPANKGKPPFDPGADALWVAEDDNAKVWDLEQADIKQLLEAIRDDVGDFAALTQTPINFLTNKISNISGDTLQIAQHSHVAKVRRRMDAMGWFFEQVVKLCFQYVDSAKANEVDAEVQWADPEVHTLAEYADLAAKYATAQIPMELVMERLGFTADEITRAKSEMERIREEDRDHELKVKAAGPKPKPQEGSK